VRLVRSDKDLKRWLSRDTTADRSGFRSVGSLLSSSLNHHPHDKGIAPVLCLWVPRCRFERIL
jgi:hypothetical protein